jgi:hypothetical protein
VQHKNGIGTTKEKHERIKWVCVYEIERTKRKSIKTRLKPSSKIKIKR